MYRILIVEDEQAIARAVAEELSHWGLESRCVENFRDVMAEFQAFQPQLVLLDIMLPFFNGYHWCNKKMLQCAHHFPVLRLGQYEHRHGDEYGRRRFHCQAF